MNDVARQVSSELWTDARLGLEAYERAGCPSEIDPTICRVCNGVGSTTGTDGGGGEALACRACNGSERAAAATT